MIISNEGLDQNNKRKLRRLHSDRTLLTISVHGPLDLNSLSAISIGLSSGHHQVVEGASASSSYAWQAILVQVRAELGIKGKPVIDHELITAFSDDS